MCIAPFNLMGAVVDHARNSCVVVKHNASWHHTAPPRKLLRLDLHLHLQPATSDRCGKGKEAIGGRLGFGIPNCILGFPFLRHNFSEIQKSKNNISKQHLPFFPHFPTWTGHSLMSGLVIPAVYLTLNNHTPPPLPLAGRVDLRPQVRLPLLRTLEQLPFMKWNSLHPPPQLLQKPLLQHRAPVVPPRPRLPIPPKV